MYTPWSSDYSRKDQSIFPHNPQYSTWQSFYDPCTECLRNYQEDKPEECRDLCLDTCYASKEMMGCRLYSK
jgi:hypothetical protein